MYVCMHIDNDLLARLPYALCHCHIPVGYNIHVSRNSPSLFNSLSSYLCPSLSPPLPFAVQLQYAPEIH